MEHGRPASAPRRTLPSGDVTQSNDATNSAKAGNTNDTVQEVTQAQAAGGADTGGDDKGGYDKSGKEDGGHEGAEQDQTATVGNETEQSAEAKVDNEQSNIAAGVTVGGSGGGSVSQSNDATNTAAAGNSNETAQAVEQGQAGTPGRHRRKRLTSPMPQTSRRTPR